MKLVLVMVLVGLVCMEGARAVKFQGFSAWFKGSATLLYDFGKRSPYTSHTIPSNPVYLFASWVNGAPVLITTQIPVFSKGPSDAGYSDLVHVVYVNTTGTSFTVNSITDEASLRDTYSEDLVTTSLYYNYPVVETGSETIPTRVSIREGWLNGTLINFFDFGVSSSTPNPVYSIHNASDDKIGNLIVDTQPGDPQYSSFWRVVKVLVDDSYSPNHLKSARDIVYSSYASTITDEVINYAMIPTPHPNYTDLNSDLISKGYTNTLDLITTPHLLRLFWKKVGTNDGSVNMALRGYGVYGWIAVGFPAPEANASAGTAMVGSDVVLVWNDGAGNLKVEGLYIHSRDLGTESAQFSDQYSALGLSNVKVWQDNIGTTLMFNRPLGAGHNPLTTTGISKYIGAFSTKYGFPSTHTAHSTTTPSTAFLKVNPPVYGLKDIHGIIMTVAYGILMFFGVLVARYAKRLPNALWFKLHMYTQYLAFLLGAAGFILGIVMMNGETFPLNTQAHTGMGVALMILTFFQFTSGLFRPHKKDEGKQSLSRRLFEIAHPVNGFLIVLMFITVLYLGFVARKWPLGVYIGYAVYLGLVLVFVVVAEVTGFHKPTPEEPQKS